MREPRELAYWFLVATLIYMTVAFHRGLRKMSAPGLSLGERKVIGNRMLIHMGLMAVTAVIVFAATR